MATQLYSHPTCIEHDPGAHHPECPDRLRSVMAGLDEDEFRYLERLEANEINLDTIAAVHGSAYIENVLDNMPTKGRVSLDPDTILSPASGEAARRASGGAVDAVNAVIGKKTDNAFCAVRPPGHHAEASSAMGFCLFNSAAIAAFHARSAHGLERVAVIDFDVHHGNGTQDIFYDNEKVLYISSHQYPYYPGSGASNEKGTKNNVLNVPLVAGTQSHEFLNAYESIFKKIREFRPEFILLSAGFDAHKDDPLAQINLESKDYYNLTKRIMTLAKEFCGEKIVSILEGGYDLNALQESVDYHIKSLME